MLELEGEAEWSQEGPTLSNDIWKKFQLIPTPPRSPSHEIDFTNFIQPEMIFADRDVLPSDVSLLGSTDFGLDLEDILIPDHLQTCGGPGGLPCAKGTCSSCTQLALAGSELRHDCMWRGTCTAEAHSFHPRDPAHRTHHESTSQIPEFLFDPSVLESAAGFTHLDDLDEEDEADLDMEVEDDLSARPDTPSESSETDTDEEDQEDDEDEEEEEDEDEGPVVHVDHSYYCPRAPSPRHAHAPTLPHTPSESEDEIDVVSVGSTDSAYSSSSSRYGGKNRTAEKRKRSGGGRSGGDPAAHLPSTPTPAIPSTTIPALPTAATITTSPRKILKVRSSVPQNQSATSTTKARHTRRLHPAEAKRCTASNNIVPTTTTTNIMTHPPQPATAPSPTNANAPYTTRHIKRITRNTSSASSTTSSSHGHHGSRKRKNNRGLDDDPEKRNLHNSLERMRRVDLRNAFEDLRTLVPDLCDREKAPKVEILRRASEHCYSLTQRGRLMEQEKEKQRRIQGELRRRLAALQKQQGRL